MGGFEKRLRDARARHGLDPAGPGAAPPPPPAATGPWGPGLRVGMELVCALAVSVGIGIALDRWLRTMPLFLVAFMLLGSAAGLLNVWRLMAPPRRNRAGRAQD